MSQDNEQNLLRDKISQASDEQRQVAIDVLRNILRSLEIHSPDQAVDIAGEKIMYLLDILEKRI